MAYIFNKVDFLKIYPQFSSVGGDLFNFELEFAQSIVNSYVPTTETDSRFKMITYNVLAYLLSLTKDPNTVGIVSSAAKGSTSVSFSIPPIANTWWGRNNYGTTALMMLRPYARGGGFINGDTPEDIVDV